MADDPHPPTSAVAAASAYEITADLAAGGTTSIEPAQALLARTAGSLALAGRAVVRGIALLLGLRDPGALAPAWRPPSRG
jgi:hypothetical protein